MPGNIPLCAFSQALVPERVNAINKVLESHGDDMGRPVANGNQVRVEHIGRNRPGLPFGLVRAPIGTKESKERLIKAPPLFHGSFVKGERIEKLLNHPLKRRESELNVAPIPGRGGLKGSTASILDHRRIARPHLWSYALGERLGTIS